MYTGSRTKAFSQISATTSSPFLQGCTMTTRVRMSASVCVTQVTRSVDSYQQS